MNKRRQHYTIQCQKLIAIYATHLIPSCFTNRLGCYIHYSNSLLIHLFIHQSICKFIHKLLCI